MTLDSLRQRLPEFGFAVYAFDPAGPVTVEVHAPDGSVFSRAGATEDEAWAGLFPPSQVKQPQQHLEPESDIHTERPAPRHSEEHGGVEDGGGLAGDSIFD